MNFIKKVWNGICNFILSIASVVIALMVFVLFLVIVCLFWVLGHIFVFALIGLFIFIMIVAGIYSALKGD